MNIDKILELDKDERFILAKSFREDINKKLARGMTRYVCRYGTLSDGHEKLTDAQKYFQAIKEIDAMSFSLEEQICMAMVSQADLYEAEEMQAETKAQQLRKEAKIRLAKNKIANALIQKEDLVRQLDEFIKVYQELRPIVESKYPEGIEQAEEDNWKAVFEYRAMKGDRSVQNIPLSPQVKAELGMNTGNMEAIAPLYFADKEKFKKSMEQLAKVHNAMLEKK